MWRPLVPTSRARARTAEHRTVFDHDDHDDHNDNHHHQPGIHSAVRLCRDCPDPL